MSEAPNPSGSKLLGKKIAGIPVLYLMVAGVLVLALVAYKMQNKTADNGDVVSEVPGPSADIANQDSGDSGGDFSANPVPIYSTTPAITTTVDTNVGWVKRGTEWSVSALGVNGVTAQTALQLYVDGANLTYAQSDIVGKVIKQFGAPPEQVTPGQVGAKPAVAAAPAQKQGPLPVIHTVKNTNDDTYSELVKLYYGSMHPTASEINLVQAANPGLPPGGPFTPGTKIKVPKFTQPKFYTSTKVTDTLAEIAKKNGVSQFQVSALNPGMRFPVKAGTRVRVV